MKALTAMKLTKEDATPGEVLPYLYLGGIGTAYNKEAMDEIGITHILTCAANIKPRFENVSEIYSILIVFCRIIFIANFHVWILQIKLSFLTSIKPSPSLKQPFS